MKKVLIVDDSAFARKLVREILSSSDDLTVVGTASNGEEALKMISRLEPDVITLDVEMPQMDGIQTLSRIMELRPTPVVMLSSLTTRGAEITIKALQLGAADAVAKPIAHGLPQLREIADDLIHKVTAASQIDASRLRLRPKPTTIAKNPVLRTRTIASAGFPIVIIASSTGGPRALRQLVPRLPVDKNAFYMVIQHLPVGFTEPMARDLNNITELNAAEAKEGGVPEPGKLLLAPAGSHAAFDRDGRIHLTQDPPLWGVRPAADVTMISAAAVFGPRIVGVVLTGMGRDGAHGLSMIKERGGKTIAEHESSCIVYGMPKAAIEAGAAEAVATLDDMPEAIDNALNVVCCRVAA